ncbi:hypothetical protein K9K77_00140 [Candidatus Babeliales bacterium]|nr:hypothetical protein [Candidatus Babeliales bacterium]
MKKTLLVISMLVVSHSIHSLKANHPMQKDTPEMIQWANNMEKWIAGNHSITSAERARLDKLKSQYGRVAGIQKWQEERMHEAPKPALTAEQQWAQDMEQWIAGNTSITSAEKARLVVLKSLYGPVEGVRKWQEEHMAAIDKK